MIFHIWNVANLNQVDVPANLERLDHRNVSNCIKLLPITSECCFIFWYRSHTTVHVWPKDWILHFWHKCCEMRNVYLSYKKFNNGWIEFQASALNLLAIFFTFNPNIFPVLQSSRVFFYWFRLKSIEDGNIPTEKIKGQVKTSHFLCDTPLLSLFLVGMYEYKFIHLRDNQFHHISYRVFFLHWASPKRLKYGKPRWGESTLT